jgi:hypothetical protein
MGIALAGVILLGAGCGDTGTAPTAKVSGVVTFNGQPVEGASVVFTPAQGRPGTGVTDATGHFTISTFAAGDGAVPGEHTVAFADSKPQPMPEGPPAEDAKPPEKPPWLTAAQTGPPRKVTVESGGGEFKFELSGGG